MSFIRYNYAAYTSQYSYKNLKSTNPKIGYLGLNVYEKEKGIFFYDHSKRKIKDDMLIKLMSYPVPVFPIVTLVLFQLVSAAQLIFI